MSSGRFQSSDATGDDAVSYADVAAPSVRDVFHDVKGHLYFFSPFLLFPIVLFIKNHVTG